MFGDTYKNKRVLITGHTGFKGSWLTLWLTVLGAKVVGYALAPPTEPNHIECLNLDMETIEGDVKDGARLVSIFRQYRPEIVFHLAAQAIVRLSYRDPVETFMTNVMGTVNVLEAARATGTVRAIVSIASDKCYENREWPWPYREIDALGGYDPYSASKGCAEIVTGCWRNGYFNPNEYGKTHETLLASCRAGNVIGGGDWAPDRLVPDLVRAAQRGEKTAIRNPHAVRPWQHVLEPLSGYLLLGQRLLEGEKQFAQPWNFGPQEDGNLTVEEITSRMMSIWPLVNCEREPGSDRPHEAGTLKLDCSQARAMLGWSPVWNIEKAILKTTTWYKAFYESGHIQSREDLESYIVDGQNKLAAWVDP